MSKSYGEFTEKFLSDLKSYFTGIDSYKSDVTFDMFKMKMYCSEQWEEIDFKCIQQICIDLGKKYESEFAVFNISKTPLFYFNSEKGKLTTKWFADIESWHNRLK